MKKFFIILFVIIVIIVIIGIAVGTLFFVLNKEKEPITKDQFSTKMQDMGFTITDASDQMADYSYVKSATLAIDGNRTYQIEFYELSDETYATAFYNNNKSIFESTKSGASTESNINGKNYSKYTLTSNGKYMVVSRVANTVAFVNVSSDLKDNVNTILKELGY